MKEVKDRGAERWLLRPVLLSLLYFLCLLSLLHLSFARL
jgi:hypothetical protein